MSSVLPVSPLGGGTAGGADRAWLLATLQRECRPLGSDVVARDDGAFDLAWNTARPSRHGGHA